MTRNQIEFRKQAQLKQTIQPMVESLFQTVQDKDLPTWFTTPKNAIKATYNFLENRFSPQSKLQRLQRV